MREERLFVNGWSFTKTDNDKKADINSIGNEEWQEVVIPHDWLIYDTRNLYQDGTGWYRNVFNLEKDETKEYLIYFDGVYMDNTVYVNGQVAGEWKYGYSSFEFNITNLLTDGENEIIVKVCFQAPNSRWYSGAGIFRDVIVKTVEKKRIATWGVYIHTERVEGDTWKLTVDTELDNLTDNGLEKLSEECELKQMIDGLEIEQESYEKNRYVCIVRNPKTWNLDEPSLYNLTTVLYVNGEETDRVQTVFGFREVRFDSEEGFFLNGKNIKINGVCEHHDLGCLGSAYNESAMRRKICILKKMGVNAIRTSHNMPASNLLKLADEMGMLINCESFDMWKRSKTEFDYARFFNDWHERDIESWIRRDRNHPSIIMWCIGNEIYDTHVDEQAVEITRSLMENVRKHDYMNNAPVTIGSNFMPWKGAQNCADVLKLAGYNYAEKLYNEHHAEHPDWMIYGSETSSTVQSRGIYHFPYDVSVLADDDEQCSSLGNCTTSWGAKNTEFVIKAERDHKFSAGQFIWSGFDYIGEPTPYHTKNSYFGQIDTAGFAKDTYYIYKAEWTDASKEPFVHVFPYWDFNDGQKIDIRVCSNLDSVELIINGKSLGRKSIDHKHGEELVPTWQTVYTKGTVEAIGYDAQGNERAKEVKNSFGEAVAIKCKLYDFDGYQHKGDEERLGFVEIYTEDANGNVVENATNKVKVEVLGGGCLLGLDNGDSTDTDQYKTNSRRLFSGKLLAVIGSVNNGENAIVKVTAPGLEGTELVIEDLNSAGRKYRAVACLEEAKEIPVRAIRLTSTKGTLLNSDCPETEVFAEIFPKNASYCDVIWTAVDHNAVMSNLVEVKCDGTSVKLKALGDGEFRLRCMSKNGKNVYGVISELDFRIEGVGTAYLDPYGFVQGAVYTDSFGGVGNGNEKGVSMTRGGRSYVGFSNLNFGDIGADTVTLPIFALDGREYSIKFYEGRPLEDNSNLLLESTYQKPMIWNVYQEETYVLRRRLKGITELYIEAEDKYHIKGFTFKKPNKAYMELHATQNSRIYGDSFKVENDKVTEIGNNVTLEFDNMDFQKTMPEKIIVCGRTPNEVNTINMRVTTEEGSTETILLEFGYSEKMEEKEFSLSGITGNTKIAFVFLPGSNFDFDYFRFE